MPSHLNYEERRVRNVALVAVLFVVFFGVGGAFVLNWTWTSRDAPFSLEKFAAEECVRKGGVPEITGHYNDKPDVHCKMPTDAPSYR